MFSVVLGLQLMLLLHRRLSPVVRFDEGGDPDPDEEDPAQDPVGHPVVVDQVEKPLGHQGADDPKSLVRRQARVRLASSLSRASTIKPSWLNSNQKIATARPHRTLDSIHTSFRVEPAQ